jgi:hypothetical protein
MDIKDFYIHLKTSYESTIEKLFRLSILPRYCAWSPSFLFLFIKKNASLKSLLLLQFKIILLQKKTDQNHVSPSLPLRLDYV